MFRHATYLAATAAITAVILSGSVLPANAVQPLKPGDPMSIRVDFDAKRTSLIEGKEDRPNAKGTLEAPDGTVGKFLETVGENAGATPVARITGTQGSEQPSRRFVYKLTLLDDKETGFYVNANVGSNGSRWVVDCTVTKGYPDSAGYRDATEFTCEGNVYGVAEASAATFTVQPNSAAEAGGSLQADSTVRLTDGRFDGNNLKYLKAPTSSTVEPGASVDFAVVMREGDSTATGTNLARARFSYRINDRATGEQTGFWVVGWSQTERNAVFQQEAACFITNEDPAKPKRPLNEFDRQLLTPYDCTIRYQSKRGWFGNYFADMVVSKRAVQEVTNPATAADLVKRFCATPNPDCLVSLSAAKKIEGRYTGEAKWRVANTTGQPVLSVEHNVTHAVSTTHKYGFEVSATAGTEFPLGPSFSVTVKDTYGYENQDRSEFSEKRTISAGPYEMFWAVLLTPVVVMDGDVLIRDKDKNIVYSLPGVHVEMPGGATTYTEGCARLENWVDSDKALCKTPSPIPTN